MISQTLEKSINGQINKEMYSAYLYLSMSAYFEKQGLKGFAKWMEVQYEEENFHAMKLYRFLMDRGGTVKLERIDAPKTEWESPIHVFEDVLKHEMFVTKCINELVDQAIEERDHAANVFLQWFVSEQVEEESNVEDVLSKLRLAGNKGNGLFMIDKELGSRVFTPPTGA